MRFKTPMLRSDLRHYSNAYIIIKDTITVEGDDDNKKRDESLFLKNNAPFRPCISKINNTFVDNAQDLGIVITIYNLLEYRDSSSWHQDVCGNNIETK